ncbi:hypothetical protein PCASD_14964 [Puccinia coronata f. sp. avenae]|uniref:Uncharacterized protein n=1 Tax=Puccinia coronata f. sp. avenae TaxID=200324 RepID=A0A2N5U7E7_9BASI|nr:hypothetical protein PCASD_14964 [Puccinia coronata f. sp. avenae]
MASASRSQKKNLMPSRGSRSAHSTSSSSAQASSPKSKGPGCEEEDSEINNSGYKRRNIREEYRRNLEEYTIHQHHRINNKEELHQQQAGDTDDGSIEIGGLDC